MNIEQLQERKTTTRIKDLKGSFFKPELIEVTIPVYELTPEEAQELNKKKIRLRWVHKEPHRKGEPKSRLYELCGKLRKG